MVAPSAAKMAFELNNGNVDRKVVNREPWTAHSYYLFHCDDLLRVNHRCSDLTWKYCESCLFELSGWSIGQIVRDCYNLVGLVHYCPVYCNSTHSSCQVSLIELH